jgi:hypothetical protein
VYHDPTFLKNYVPPEQSSLYRPAQKSTLTRQQKADLQAQSAAYQKKIAQSPYGQYGVPQIDPETLQSVGIPWFLAQHPNRYSANPNEVLLYNNGIKFAQSDFYKKYSPQMKTKTSVVGFGGESRVDLKGKDFRIVFRSTDPKDSSIMYLDCDNQQMWIQVMQDAYASRLLVPVEFAAQQNVKQWKAQTQASVLQQNSLIKNAWSQGYDHAAQSYQDSVDLYRQKAEYDIEQQKQQIGQQEQQIGQLQSAASAGSGGSDGFGSIVSGIASLF